MDIEVAIEMLKSGVGTEIFKQIYQLPGKAYNKLGGKIANAFHQYEKKYRERHGQVKVFCVGMREPIPLDDVYVAVQFLDDRSASKYGSLEDIEKAFRQRYRNRSISSSDERKDGRIAANEKQYLMLLGGPGVGKSTFLRKIGLEALKGKNGSFEHKCIPVFLELKRFTADEINIEMLITEEFRTCGFPDPERMTEKALKSGKLLILFDGLDEVPDANVDNVVREIGDFVDRYSKNRFIASCRIAAYKGGFKRFTEVEMAAFDDAQIETYIKNWFDSTPDDYRRQLDTEMGTAQKCWNTLNTISHQATKELARNPLLLTLLCMVYNNSQNFPRNRADLYEKALSIFLEEWAAEKRIGREESISQYLDIADEKRMLSKIAAKNFDENRFFFSKDELIDQIQKFGDGNTNTPQTFNASKILETILVDQGLFIEQVSGSYSFSHLTFQESLTANYVVRNTESMRGLVREHLHDERWREVFLLTAGRMHEADDLLLAMEAEAAKCISTDGLKRLFRWAEHITEASNDKIGGGVKKIGGGIKKIEGDVKRKFAIYQCWSLQLLNTIHEAVNNRTREDRNCDPLSDFASDIDRDRDFYYYFQQDLYLDFYLHFYRDLDLIPTYDLYLYLDKYEDLAPDLLLYLDILGFYVNRYLYFDFYFYMDLNFYVHVPSKIVDQFDKELVDRITLVERIKAAKIFKGVDWQRIVERLKQQQTFIKAARKGEAVEPPQESIHDTWLSVLQIPPKTLTLSSTELQNCVQYLQAVELIVDCKEAAGRVSPEVWDGIEKRFLTSEAAEIKA